MESKITALEEEISILKGEIKSILQEVRTAILASENPFAGGSTRPAALAIPASTEPAPVFPVPAPPGSALPPEPRRSFITVDDEPDAPLATRSEQPARWSPSPEPASFDEPRRRPRPRQHFSSDPDPVEADDESISDAQETRPKKSRIRVDVRALAALAVWVEETRERLDDERLRIVLGLGRYGGLIDEELEAVLTEISALVAQPAERGQASLNDCLVALRQLDAVMRDEDGSIQTRDRLRRSA